MSKDIKEFMKYYIGCEVAELPKGKHDGMMIDRITSVEENGNIFVSNGYMIEVEKVKPILRKLESMTENEAIKGGWSSLSHFNYYRQGNNGTFYPEDFHFLLSLGFDLFNLIPEELAIDKETLKG